MIRLLFTYEREIIIFEIDNKKIVYRDRKWEKGISFIPKDADFIKRVIFSRNALSHNLIKWISEANSGNSLAEWQACKNDDEVADIVIRDARSRGCLLKKRFTAEEIARHDAQQAAKQEYYNKVDKQIEQIEQIHSIKSTEGINGQI